MVLEEMQTSTARNFQAYGRPLNLVTELKYLGRILMASYDDLPAVVGNLRKSWAWLSRILEREGANPRVSGMFFKEVVQAVLLFWSETWVMIPRMGRSLGGGVRHKVVR